MTESAEQADLLGRRFDCVVANPPYGWEYFAGRLKDFVADHYKEAKADLYACFIQRNLTFAKPNGFVGMITIPNWMFLSYLRTFAGRCLKAKLSTASFTMEGVFSVRDYGYLRWLREHFEEVKEFAQGITLGFVG